MVLKMYNRAAERLWEKIESYRDQFRIACLDAGGGATTWNAFCEAIPDARRLATEVETEFDYGLSGRQCNWAVRQACANVSMGAYNRSNGTSLQPRV